MFLKIILYLIRYKVFNFPSGFKLTERYVAYQSRSSDEVRPLLYVCFIIGINSDFIDILLFVE